MSCRAAPRRAGAPSPEPLPSSGHSLAPGTSGMEAAASSASPALCHRDFPLPAAIFPAAFFSLLIQGVNCFFLSKGHSWRSDPPGLSVLRSSDTTFPLSLSSVSSHSCVFRCLTFLTTPFCPVLTRCTLWNAALKDHPGLQPRLGQL